MFGLFYETVSTAVKENKSLGQVLKEDIFYDPFPETDASLEPPDAPYEELTTQQEPLMEEGEKEFSIGQRVECRDDREAWKKGIVKSVDPLKVQPDGWDKAYGWDEVRPIAGAFKIGDRVECRDGTERWRKGIVKSAQPLQVQPDGWDKAYGWDEVRKLVD
jgi:hypothetical protein